MSGPGPTRYAVKFPNNPQSTRVLFNDHVCGRLARTLDLPCPGVTIVDVSPEAAAGVDLGGKPGDPGAAHGSEWLEDVDPIGLDVAIPLGDNRRRYTMLMVLYSIVAQHDSQFVYEKAAPNRLFSVDHGHTFLNENWTSDQLESAAELTDLRRDGGHELDKDALTEVRERLSKLSEMDIAELVSCIPGSWRVTLDERCAAAAFLWRRIAAAIQLIDDAVKAT